MPKLQLSVERALWGSLDQRARLDLLVEVEWFLRNCHDDELCIIKPMRGNYTFVASMTAYMVIQHSDDELIIVRFRVFDTQHRRNASLSPWINV
jgi:hypothetical protein